jgi:hypothetical protein
MIRWWLAKRRAAGWRDLRQQNLHRSLQHSIRVAEQVGDFKFLRRPLYGFVLLRRRSGYRNTWDFVESFVTKFSARSYAAKLASVRVDTEG